MSQHAKGGESFSRFYYVLSLESAEESKMSDRLNNRLETLEQQCSIDSDLELGRLISERLEAGVISPEAAQRVVALVEKGHLSPELAAQRLRAIDLENSASYGR